MPLPYEIWRKLPVCPGPDVSVYGAGTYDEVLFECPRCGEGWDWHDATPEIVESAAGAVLGMAGWK